MKKYNTDITAGQFWLDASIQAASCLVVAFLVMGIGTLVLALI